jgi:hypothetical protein
MKSTVTSHSLLFSSLKHTERSQLKKLLKKRRNKPVFLHDHHSSPAPYGSLSIPPAATAVSFAAACYISATRLAISSRAPFKTYCHFITHANTNPHSFQKPFEAHNAPPCHIPGIFISIQWALWSWTRAEEFVVSIDTKGVILCRKCCCAWHHIPSPLFTPNPAPAALPSPAPSHFSPFSLNSLYTEDWCRPALYKSVDIDSPNTFTILFILPHSRPCIQLVHLDPVPKECWNRLRWLFHSVENCERSSLVICSSSFQL